MGEATEGVRLSQNRIKHGHEIAGRGIDDLQYLSGRGLLLQRLSEASLCLGKLPASLVRLLLQNSF
jgi:hypothetical protein